MPDIDFLNPRTSTYYLRLIEEQTQLQEKFLFEMSNLLYKELKVAKDMDDISDICRGNKFDLRKTILGKNWYHSEKDGRWAGGATYSTLMLKSSYFKPNTKYLVKFRFARFANYELAEKMKITVNGKVLKLAKQGFLSKNILRLLKHQSKDKYWHEMAAIIRLSDIAANKELDLRFEFPYTVKKPNDIREFTARLTTIEFLEF